MCDFFRSVFQSLEATEDNKPSHQILRILSKNEYMWRIGTILIASSRQTLQFEYLYKIHVTRRNLCDFFLTCN